jgi:RNA polymerase sigma factor (sigma-70 family)
MSSGQFHANRQLERLFRSGSVGGMTDSQLLEQFVTGENAAAELAFEAIVKRHGPMVFRVCRTVLRDLHAAEDAFQATFLVLARKAGRLGSRELLGNWLYGVASRTARKARTVAGRRRARDLQLFQEHSPLVAVAEAPRDPDQDELEQVVQQEIDRLPRSYRAAVVTCYLEGLTQAQAAQELRLAESTVRGRLARARRLLGERLKRRGLAGSAGMAVLGGPAGLRNVSLTDAAIRRIARAALQFARHGHATPGIVSATAQGIASGVLSTMYLNSIRTIVTTTIAAILLTAGTAFLMQHRAAAQPQPQFRAAANADDSETAGGAEPVMPVPEPETPVGLAPDPEAPPAQDVQTGRSKSRLAKGRGARQTQDATVDPELAKRAPGTIERAVPLSKDCLILAYLPNQNLGGVDNLALLNYDGGGRVLIDWPNVAPEDAAAPDRRFLIAIYSRKTTSHAPAGPVHAFELIEGWNEFSSWSAKPNHDPEPAATYKFEPGDGWKLFDITKLVRDQAKAGRANHGILLRFLSEDFSIQKENWSGYEFVSREGTGVWASRRPVLLVVKGS